MSDPAKPPRIGILDSGVGGLSVLREIHALLPGADLHYVGDSARCPYGTKPPAEIAERVFEIAGHLLAEGSELLVIACNSATIHGVGPLREFCPIPVVGMEPGVKPAAALTKSGVVGVLATEASIAGEKFHHLLSTHARGMRVVTRPVPRFVELVERGTLDGPEVDDAVSEALSPLLEAGADVVVLGCTHYPFLLSAIERQLPPGIAIVDTGPAVARRVASFMKEADFSGKPSGIHIETTGTLSELERLLPILLPDIPATTALATI